MAKVKSKTPMEKLTAGYEKLMEGKTVSTKGKTVFNNVLKKATTTKPRGSK